MLLSHVLWYKEPSGTSYTMWWYFYVLTKTDKALFKSPSKTAGEQLTASMECLGSESVAIFSCQWVNGTLGKG